jgi:hypothetical protein
MRVSNALSEQQLTDWAFLDNVDVLAATFQRAQAASTFGSRAGARRSRDVKVIRPAHLTGRGSR